MTDDAPRPTTGPRHAGAGRRRLRTLAAVAALGVTLPLTCAVPAVAAGEPEVVAVASVPEPSGEAVTLDAAIYAPGGPERRPAVILAHGFGGSRADLDGPARELVDRGYVVLAYSARGFGDSGGRIHLMDPAYDGADVRALVDTLARRPDVRLDAPGDPRVGMTGGSYGGAATLLGGGLDPRLDALVAGITWNDLQAAFLPTSLVGATDTPAALAPPTADLGVFKRRWASQFFTGAVAAGMRGDGGRTGGDRARTGGDPAGASAGEAAACGRFDPTICRLFLAASTSGRPSAELAALLRAHSPARVTDRITAPTMLLQGMHDSLFGLDQADATARALAARGVPVAVHWFEGGHDGGEMPARDATVGPFFDGYLKGDGGRTAPLPVDAFTAAVPALRRGAPERSLTAPAYPGLPGAPAVELVPLGFTDPARRGVLLSPPGGDPAATVVLPGATGAAGGAMAAAAYPLAALPGQSVAFDTAPVAAPTTVVGAPRVRLTVTSSTTDATLFLSFWRVTGDTAITPRQLVAPLRLATTPGVPVTVEAALPAGTYALDAGTTWRVLVSASDSSYATPTDARSYTVALADPHLRLLTVPQASTPPVPPDGEVRGLLIALAVVLAALALGGGLLVARHRRADAAALPELADVPLAVAHLVKTYKDGHRAVDDVTWEARRGQVVGLLGPNGAGKTTTIRMIVGLIAPDSGGAYVHGVPVRSGSAALGGLGALVEGPGFLPHLTGRANLEAYWDATGRPRAEARFEEALEVAALGDALDRPVKSYSQGMRQRLGIAQAMLGMPEVLLLDEPTNGLDPPQIAAMRPVLRRYAETGRTVVVSSHLLAEVEMTCTDVVVMNKGKVVLTGSIADLVDAGGVTVVDLAPDADAERARTALAALPGLGAPGAVRVETEGDRRRLVATAAGEGAAARADIVAAVVASGAGVVGVSGRRHLEEVFLGVIAADGDGAADLAALHQVRPR